jgi:Ca2+:H+ antiporter
LGAVFLTVLIGAMVAGDGKANWFKGVQLITVYVIMAIMFYFLPGSH